MTDLDTANLGIGAVVALVAGIVIPKAIGAWWDSRNKALDQVPTLTGALEALRVELSSVVKTLSEMRAEQKTGIELTHAHGTAIQRLNDRVDVLERDKHGEHKRMWEEIERLRTASHDRANDMTAAVLKLAEGMKRSAGAK